VRVSEREREREREREKERERGGGGGGGERELLEDGLPSLSLPLPPSPSLSFHSPPLSWDTLRGLCNFYFFNII
jgi:hypothetical protein